jgi:hypothetical protein
MTLSYSISRTQWHGSGQNTTGVIQYSTFAIAIVLNPLSHYYFIILHHTERHYTITIGEQQLHCLPWWGSACSLRMTAAATIGTHNRRIFGSQELNLSQHLLYHRAYHDYVNVTSGVIQLVIYDSCRYSIHLTLLLFGLGDLFRKLPNKASLLQLKSKFG